MSMFEPDWFDDDFFFNVVFHSLLQCFPVFQKKQNLWNIEQCENEGKQEL